MNAQKKAEKEMAAINAELLKHHGDAAKALRKRRGKLLTEAADRLEVAGAKNIDPAKLTKEQLKVFVDVLVKDRPSMLLRAVAIACERAYRRGVQHGTLAGKDSTEVMNWRYPRNRKKHGTAVAIPIHTKQFGGGPITSAVERFGLEERNLFDALMTGDRQDALEALTAYLNQHS